MMNLQNAKSATIRNDTVLEELRTVEVPGVEAEGKAEAKAEVKARYLTLTLRLPRRLRLRTTPRLGHGCA